MPKLYRVLIDQFVDRDTSICMSSLWKIHLDRMSRALRVSTYDPEKPLSSKIVHDRNMIKGYMFDRYISHISRWRLGLYALVSFEDWMFLRLELDYPPEGPGALAEIETEFRYSYD
jgi:hypothetical protein